MTVPTAAVEAKAQRLLDGGWVQPDPAPAQVFQVRGDHGTYTVVVSAHVQLCSCPAYGDCSHKRAAVRWVLAGDQERARLEEALAVRHACDHDAADQLFARLGA